MIKYRPFVLLTVLTSCGIYRQNVVNTPLMVQQGQIQIGGHRSFNGFEGQSAYALTNKIALLANYADRGARKEQTSSNSYEVRKHSFGELGAGVYKKTTSGRVHEFFVLAGRGRTTDLSTGKNEAGVIRTSNREAYYSRVVIQADLGSKNKKVETILSPRLMSVHYYHMVDDTRNDYTGISNFHVYFEAVITCRWHVLKNLMVLGQVNTTMPIIYSKGVNDYYEFSPFNASIGLVLNWDLIKPNK